MSMRSDSLRLAAARSGRDALLDLYAPYELARDLLLLSNP